MGWSCWGSKGVSRGSLGTRVVVPLFRDFIAAFGINEKPCFQDGP